MTLISSSSVFHSENSFSFLIRDPQVKSREHCCVSNFSVHLRRFSHYVDDKTVIIFRIIDCTWKRNMRINMLLTNSWSRLLINKYRSSSIIDQVSMSIYLSDPILLEPNHEPIQARSRKISDGYYSYFGHYMREVEFQICILSQTNFGNYEPRLLWLSIYCIRVPMVASTVQLL